jgi:hypothetical protein
MSFKKSVIGDGWSFGAIIGDGGGGGDEGREEEEEVEEEEEEHGRKQIFIAKVHKTFLKIKDGLTLHIK